MAAIRALGTVSLFCPPHTPLPIEVSSDSELSEKYAREFWCPRFETEETENKHGAPGKDNTRDELPPGCHGRCCCQTLAMCGHCAGRPVAPDTLQPALYYHSFGIPHVTVVHEPKPVEHFTHRGGVNCPAVTNGVESERVQ
ncbi:hypothetical protein EYF80_010072 [Liparis tanakae]|uniref:Uncharacterized protein n=1 Tax=Liparis tanakae TaxID=230148 RepID=A0A4Z2IPU7_9TELE|nr:hypothetical protein EYF80_010072 [Liparis tanakae]